MLYLQIDIFSAEGAHFISPPRERWVQSPITHKPAGRHRAGAPDVGTTNLVAYVLVLKGHGFSRAAKTHEEQGL